MPNENLNAIRSQAMPVVAALTGQPCTNRGTISYTYLCESDERAAITGENFDFLFECDTGLTYYWSPTIHGWKLVGADAEE